MTFNAFTILNKTYPFFSFPYTNIGLLISKSCSENQVEYSVPVSQVFCKISVLSILVRVHVMSKSIVYILVIAGIQPRYAYPVHF